MLLLGGHAWVWRTTSTTARANWPPMQLTERIVRLIRELTWSPPPEEARQIMGLQRSGMPLPSSRPPPWH